MTMILILGLALLAVGVGVAVRALTTSKASVTTVGHIEQYGFAGQEARTSRDEHDEGLVARTATGIGLMIERRFSAFDEEALRFKLLSGGIYSISPTRFLGYQGLLCLTFLLLWVWIAGLADASILVLIVGGAAAVALGWLLPLAWLTYRIRKRREQIEYELPELVDLLVVSVEAGTSLPGAFRMAAREVRGPLGEELRLTLQEQNMGLSSTEALEHLSSRADTPGVRVFVRSIIQGELLGISLGQIMRNLADEMRKRRKAAAEERAQKAPIKMVFPLVLLIFPAMMVVLLLPALLNLSKFFS